jgi:hypothetical protein
MTDTFRRSAFPTLLFLSLMSALPSHAQLTESADGKALILSNDKLNLTIKKQGGAISSLVLKNDPTKMSALSPVYGHFICVDGFGPVSKEEAAAGMTMHGEATKFPAELVSSGKEGNTFSADFTTTLPLVQEIFRRKFSIVDGENVIYVKSELESLLAFDRPVSWGEHLTIGSPFLERGNTSVEISAQKAMTRPYDAPNEGKFMHRLASGKEFTWPMAPTLDGRLTDIRTVTATTPIVDRTASLMDESRKYVFITALNKDKHLLLGYMFKREDYPWMQTWEFYQANGDLTRGLEFAIQPFDVPRRDMVDQHSMFGTPTYKWLPAKSKINSSFLMFWTEVPTEMTKVDDVILENGLITVYDNAAKKTIILKASAGL